MRDLVSTWAPCRVQIRGLPGEHVVSPPTARQAITIIAAIESLHERDASSELRRIAFEWLPLRLASMLFVRTAHPLELTRDLGQLLAVGVRDLDRHEESVKTTKKKATKTSWFEVVAEYSTTYGTTITEVLDTPWPLFVAMASQMWKMQAREQLRNANWYASAKLGKMDEITERAGYSPAGIPDDYEMPEVMKDPKWSEEQVEKAKRLGQMMRQKKGEA